MLSPLGANVMTSSQKYSGPGTHLSYGLLGSVADVPAGYTLEFVLSVGRGVRPAMLKWGDLLLANSGKQRDAAWDLDYSLRYLGYMRRAQWRAIFGAQFGGASPPPPPPPPQVLDGQRRLLLLQHCRG